MPKKIAAFCIQAECFHLVCLEQGKITRLVSENLSDMEEKTIEQQLLVFKERYQLGKYTLRYVLSFDQILIRSIDVPVELKTSQILNWLRLQVAKAFNAKAEDFVMDYQLTKNPDGDKLQYVLVKRKLIDQVFQRCLNAGLNLKAIHVDIFALQQLVALHFCNHVLTPYLYIANAIKTLLVFMSHEKIIFSQSYPNEDAMVKIKQIIPGAKQILANQDFELADYNLPLLNLTEEINKKYSISINDGAQIFLVGSLANELMKQPSLIRKGSNLIHLAWKKFKRNE